MIDLPHVPEYHSLRTPTAIYLHDPDSSSRTYHQYSPTSIAASNSLKCPTPSAGSVGKNRFQELSRSYDFGDSLRSIRNALTRSGNNSREGALSQAGNGSGSGSVGSLSGQNLSQYAGTFGAGGHSIAKIGSHPGLNALERQQLQAQFGSGVGGSGSSSSAAAAAARFPDVHNMAAQEHSFVWDSTWPTTNMMCNRMPTPPWPRTLEQLASLNRPTR